MHYDIDSGAKDTRGIFSKLTVITLSILLVLFCVYMSMNWFAPDLFFIISDNRIAIENIVKSQPVQGDMLRIPSLEIEREIVPKKAEGKIQIVEKNGDMVLSGMSRSLGVTPFDTKNLSPLALLGRVEIGTRIYVDFNGTRTAYQVTEVLENTQPNPEPVEGLVVYALDGSGKIATVGVRAEKLGEVKP